MMHDLDTAQLRRLANDSARKHQRQFRLGLFVVHFILYAAAMVVMGILSEDAPGVSAAIWNSIDLSLIVFGLFFGWGVGLLLHGVGVIIESDWAERRFRQQAVTGAVGRVLLGDEDEAVRAEAVKAKRTLDDLANVALADDGELLADDEEARARRQ